MSSCYKRIYFFADDAFNFRSWKGRCLVEPRLDESSTCVEHLPSWLRDGAALAAFRAAAVPACPGVVGVRGLGSPKCGSKVWWSVVRLGQTQLRPALITAGSPRCLCGSYHMQSGGKMINYSKA